MSHTRVGLKEKEPFSEKNTLKFYLNAKCTRKPQFARHKAEELKSMRMEDYLDNHLILAEKLVWEPIGDQAERFKSCPPKMLFDGILIDKLAENQELEFEVYCTLGVGKTHTKWSPVATTFYRLVPKVTILEPVNGEDAKLVKELCPAGVFDIEDIKGKGKGLKVVDSHRCTSCKACSNHDQLGKHFEVGKESNSYHFTIESVGVIPPETLFLKALEVLRQKARTYLSHISEL